METINQDLAEKPLSNTPPPHHSNTPLRVSSLSLHNFRNYETARIETDAQRVVLWGKNGAGKTNILEAISLLTPGRGLRRSKLSEMDNMAKTQPWAIAAHIAGMQGPAQLGTGRVEEEGADKRLVKIDEKTAPQAQLGTHLAILWLTPQMEKLFQDGVSASRKFLDRLVYSFDPEHASRVNEYDYAMRERNKLLQNKSGDRVWLDSLELSMSETATAIGQARLAAIDGMNKTMHASTLSFPKANLAVIGFTENNLQLGKPVGMVEKELKMALAKSRPQDAVAGRALLGAHRSQLRVKHVEKDMPAEACSTGEQKALLLSIVLSQARTTSAKKGIVPVLLLDEVAAHLDAIRRLELFEEICQIGAQTWMTGTDENLFADLKGKAHYFQVDNGNVSSSA